MKLITGKLGSIIVVLAAVALLISAVAVFSEPISSFFDEILDKEVDIAKDMMDGIDSPQASAALSTSVGKYLVLNNVNDSSHNLKVNLTSDTITDFSSVRIWKYGSNLLNVSQMLNSQLVDNGDGTYTFTKHGGNFGERTSAFCDVYIPAGVPFVMSVKEVDSNFSNHLYSWIVFDDGTTDTYHAASATTCKTYDKAVVQVCFLANDFVLDGEYITFNEPKLTVGDDRVYEKYVVPQTTLATADGTVSNLKSLSPTVTLLADNEDVEITCEYKKKQ